MVNFDFLGKSLGIISPPHFVFDFSKKNVSYVLLTDQISLPLFLEILGNMCIVVYLKLTLSFKFISCRN